MTTAVIVGSVITFSAAIAFGLTRSKDESAYQAVVYSSLIGVGSGALLGLAYRSKESQKILHKSSRKRESLAVIAAESWKNWRDFAVIRKVKESEKITSFYLQPLDKGEIPFVLPGQFLTIKSQVRKNCFGTMSDRNSWEKIQTIKICPRFSHDAR